MLYKEKFKKFGRVSCLLFCVSVASPVVHAQDASYTHQTGLAPAGVVIPVAVPIITETWGPGCASVIFRIAMLMGNAWYDAIAPYHATAVGINTDLGRRPPTESADMEARNIAMLYASYRLLGNQFPSRLGDFRRMMTSVGLDPDDNQRNTTTPIGIGNMAGDGVVARALVDGMNQTGDDGNCVYNCEPFQDTTGYRPVNSIYEVIDASRWQPYIHTSGNGIFTGQTFVTPQYATAVPYSYSDPTVFSAPPPVSSDPGNFTAYKLQADIVLNRSAVLTDRAKVQAELFDNKFRGYAGAIFTAARNNIQNNNIWVHYYFTANLAAYDAGIAAWQEKTRYDSVRPYTAIPYIYGDSPVRAWGGVGKGTVTDLPASQWRQYLNVADHPEYPSGSGIFCAALAQSGRRFMGTDVLNFRSTYNAGTSDIEPGITPASTITLNYPTWTAWETSCYQARVDGGVHFPASVEAAPGIGHPIADLAYDFVQRHIAGNP